MTCGTQEILCSPPPAGGAHVRVTRILFALVEIGNFRLTNSPRGRHRLVYLIIPPRGENVKRRKGLLSFSQQFLPWPQQARAMLRSPSLIFGTERQYFYPSWYRLGLCVRKLFLKNNKCRHGP